ncbi:MAG: HAMP domain-containing protein [Spirochaetes bacterium]|nr:MAG: HAMP domain-containing protein [Spirochaetota bacterium]
MTGIGGFSLRVTIVLAALFLAAVLALALGFNFIAVESARTLRETLRSGSDALQRERTVLLVERLKADPVGGARDLAAKLRVHARADTGILHALIYARTPDDNFFELLESVSLNPGFRVQLPESRIVQEEKEMNFLRRALVSAVTDPETRRADGLYWQTVYTPIPVLGKIHVLQLFVSVTGQYGNFAEYTEHSDTARALVAGLAALIALLLAGAGWLLAHNYSILVRGLSSHMDRAAKGDLSISLRPTSDTELASLALSFNTLIGEMRGLKETRDREQATEETGSDTAGSTNGTGESSQDAPARTAGDANRAGISAAPAGETDTAEKPGEPEPNTREQVASPAPEEPHPDPYDEIFKHGVALLKEQRTADAIDIFRALIVMTPSGFGSLFNLGVAYARAREYALSASMFRRSLEVQPDHETARQYLAKVERFGAGEDRHDGHTG